MFMCYMATVLNLWLECVLKRYGGSLVFTRLFQWSGKKILCLGAWTQQQ